MFIELVSVAEWWANVTLKLYIDKGDWEKYFGKEHGYCIMNHSYEIDWLMGWMACEKMRVLGVSHTLVTHKHTPICYYHTNTNKKLLFRIKEN